MMTQRNEVFHPENFLFYDCLNFVITSSYEGMEVCEPLRVTDMLAVRLAITAHQALKPADPHTMRRPREKCRPLRRNQWP